MNLTEVIKMFEVNFERGWVECKLCPKHADGTSHTGRAFELVEESWYLYHAMRHINKHLTEYGEDDKEHQLDDGPSADTAEIYAAMIESTEAPSGGYHI